MIHDVFLSYSHQDMAIATTIVSILEQNGTKCWIDYRDATPGEDYAGSIVRAIRSSRFFVFILTKHSNVSPHIVCEVNSAIKHSVPVLTFKIDNCTLVDSLEYYIDKTQMIDASTPPLDSHITKLIAAIRFHQQKKNTSHTAHIPHTISTGQCRIVNYQEALAVGYSAKNIAMQLVENDYITCNGIGLANEGTAEQWESFLNRDSDTFHYFLNEKNEIVGNWSIVSLTEDAYEKAIQGALLEVNIGIENTNMILFPGVYDGYILAISLLPAYRNMQNYTMLVDSLLKQLEHYAENGIFFRRWCINVFSSDVEALVRQLGFRYRCNNCVTGKLYECMFMPLPRLHLLKRYPKLEALYARNVTY